MANNNYIPIIARELLPDLAELVLGSGSADFSKLELALDSLKECGFNTFIAEIPYGNISKLLPGVLSRCSRRGLRVIIQSNTFEPPSDHYLNEWKEIAENNPDLSIQQACKNGFDGRIKDFMEKCEESGYSSAFAGVLLDDEPTFDQLEAKFPKDQEKKEEKLSDFDNTEGSYYCLRNRYKLVKKRLPSDAAIIVNLVGVKIDSHIPNNVSYGQYLDEFAGIEGSGTIPKLWCYDLYPVTESNYLLETNFALDNNNTELPALKDNGKVKVDYDNFYNDLRLFHEKASRKGSKFWTYVLSMEFMATQYYHPVREPFLRFAVFSSLAMGCKGILYWTYHQRKNASGELYLSAPIDMQERKTASWYFAKQINSEIARFNSVFADTVLLDYGHAGVAHLGTKPIRLPMGRLEGISGSSEGTLVTRLSDIKHEYIVIVSRDVTRYQDLSISFRGFGKILEMTPYVISDIVQMSSTDDAVSIIKRTVTPGGYLIFRYEV